MFATWPSRCFRSVLSFSSSLRLCLFLRRPLPSRCAIAPFSALFFIAPLSSRCASALFSVAMLPSADSVLLCPVLSAIVSCSVLTRADAGYSCFLSMFTRADAGYSCFLSMLSSVVLFGQSVLRLFFCAVRSLRKAGFTAAAVTPSVGE